MRSTDMTADTQLVFTAAVRCAFSAEPTDLSLLYFLWYAATAGTFSQLVDVTSQSIAAESTRFTYGTSDLVTAMAADAGAGNIQVDARVTTITEVRDGGGNLTGYEVVTASQDGTTTTWSAGRIIVAMSPDQCAGIKFRKDDNTELLSPDRLMLQQKMQRGDTIKGFLRFKEPFWRSLGGGNGYSGYILSTAPYGQYPAVWVLDNCWAPRADQRDPVRAYPNSRSSLMTFIVGDSAKAWRNGGNPGATAAQRKSALVEQLAAAFGMSVPAVQAQLDERPGQDAYSEFDWNQGAGLGCPAGILGPNVLSTVGKTIREPVGKIFWAGTETALEWAGYMNGAIAAGVRAALEASG
jgi:monoamine oxidase